MPKLYKAVDVTSGGVCSFVVIDNGRVMVSAWWGDDDFEIDFAMEESSCAECYMDEYEEPSRFNDAIDPILIAEW